MTTKSRGVVRLLSIGAFAAAICLAAGPTQAAGLARPPAPQAAQAAPDGTPGTIYYGATPPGGGTNKPVLVFVQGLHGQANTWWTNGNDMYSDAYYAGYRTAFVDLIDAGGTGGSIWANGQMLAGQLGTITGHYGVGSVNIVAHSKGGLDSNSAAIRYGAAPKVQTLFQLASPNWGSQLADLSYSWWSWWLAAILGQRDDAIYSLQTGQMSAFRGQVDGLPANSLVHYRTSAGTSHGSLFGALWWSGAYLQAYGDNDGAATVSSTHHPLGTHVFTDGNLNHDQMPIGANTWSRVQPYVSTLWRSGLAPGDAAPAAPADPYALLPAADIIRGGALDGRAVERFPVEPGATALHLAALTNAGVSVVLRGPDGRTYGPSAIGAGSPDQPLGAAQQSIFGIATPAAGEWQAEFSSALPSLGGKAPAGAYLLVAEVAGPIRVSLSRASGPLTFPPGGTARFTLSATAAGAALHNLAVETHLTGGATSSASQALLSDGDSLALTLPAAPGVYNLSLTVRGSDAQGAPFERSLTSSFAVGTATPGQ